MRGWKKRGLTAGWACFVDVQCLAQLDSASGSGGAIVKEEAVAMCEVDE